MSAKTAIVTGASSGIGRAIAERLRGLGYGVVAIARWRDGIPDRAAGLRPVVVDLGDAAALRAAVETFPSMAPEGIDILVNAAGVGHFAPHRSIDPDGVAQMTSVNLLAPMILCRLCLPALERKRGRIINIASITARQLGKRGAAYAATKAGLLHFGRNLFEEVRKSGVSVTTILPDLTDTPFYDRLDFAPAKNREAAIHPDTIADALQHILEAPRGTVLEEVVLRPQRLCIEKRPARRSETHAR